MYKGQKVFPGTIDNQQGSCKNTVVRFQYVLLFVHQLYLYQKNWIATSRLFHTGVWHHARCGDSVRKWVDEKVLVRCISWAVKILRVGTTCLIFGTSVKENYVCISFSSCAKLKSVSPKILCVLSVMSISTVIAINYASQVQNSMETQCHVDLMHNEWQVLYLLHFSEWCNCLPF